MPTFADELEDLKEYYGERRLLLKVDFPGIIFPCPRPQVARSRSGGTIAYYPEEYSRNKKKLKESIEAQIKKTKYSPPESVMIWVKYYGVEQIGPRSSRDGDNMLKTVFDALADAGALPRTDTLAEVQSGFFRWIPDALDNHTEIQIYEAPSIDFRNIRKIHRKAEAQLAKAQQRV